MTQIMNTALLRILLSILPFTVFSQASDWNNGGGNPSRNALALVNGPLTDSVLWQDTPAGLFGMPGYIEGNKLVTMRFLSMTNAPIVCYDLLTGEQLWQIEITGLAGRSLPVGFRDNQVYAVRFTESLHDSIYAFSADDGSKVWTADVTVCPYITASTTFASNGDLLIEGYFQMYRIDHLTGHKIWQAPVLSFVLGACEMSVYNNTGYTLEQIGGVAYLWAIDLDTGEKKYSHRLNDTHPGGGLQQAPFMVGSDGTIYVQKQGDNVSAFTDTGTELKLDWETEIFGNAPFSQMCVGPDGSVYAPSDGRIIRLNPSDGQIMNTSAVICNNSELFQLRLSATYNDLIFATNGENRIYAFSQELTEVWSDNIPNLNTCGAVIGSNGLVAVSGANIIKVYTPENYAGESEKIESDDLTIYPNPAVSLIHLQASENEIRASYAIIDLSGKVMRSGQLASESTTVDLSGLPSGNYILLFAGKKEGFYKIIKQ
jgi:outer membrane protein assembly factor BamB